MSLKEKVGQLFVVGFPGTKFNKRMAKLIRDIKPGSMIIFGRNIKSFGQIARLNTNLQRYSLKNTKIPLFIMVDQEGGSVSRIKLTPTPPSALAIAKTQNPALATAYGHVTGQLLSHLGFNFNLAPVADISDPNIKNFIGNRSFGNDPELVSTYAYNFASGLQKQKVIPTFKHFPGHGNTITDSHQKLPLKNQTLSEIEAFDLVPFKNLADQKLPAAIMTAHISFPKIEPSGKPATFSKKLITGILREKLKFKGLILTDDLQMKATGVSNDIGLKAVAAINAGCDLLMIAWTKRLQYKAFRGVLKAVNSGKLSEQRINASVKRILTYKYQNITVKTSLNGFYKTLRKKKRQINLFSRKVNKLNFSFELKKRSLDSAYLNTKFLVFSSNVKFFKIFKKLHTNSKFYRLKKNKKIRFLKLFKASKKITGLFYITGAGTADVLNSLPSYIKQKIIVINTTYPGIVNPNEYLALYNLYSKDSLSSKWLYNSLKNRTLASD